MIMGGALVFPHHLLFGFSLFTNPLPLTAVLLFTLGQGSEGNF
jgi:hypothetical protein